MRRRGGSPGESLVLRRAFVKGSDTAFFSDLLIGRVDGGDLLGRHGHKFWRNRACDHLVRMIVGDELPVVNFERIIADLWRDAL